MSVAVQYVVRPNPGTDPAKITELAKEGAALWRGLPRALLNFVKRSLP